MSAPTLARRTRLLMVAVAALSVLVVFVVFYMAWTSFTIRLRTDELARQALVMARGASAAGSDAADPEGVQGRLFRVEAGLIGATLVLADEDGAVLLSSSETDEAGRRYPVDRLGEPDERGVRSAVADVEGIGRVLMVSAPTDGEEAALVIALQPVREVNRTRGWVALLLAASAAIAVLVAWVAGGWSARMLAGPIVRLEQASEAVAAGEWGRQVDVEGGDEVGRLATAFNRMSSRVAAAYASQKEFVGNVSHELRTPITSIAGFSGALLDGTVADDAARERYLRLVKDEADRLGDLVSMLLALADLDAGVVEPAREPMDLAAVARVLRERHSPAAAERGVLLDLEALSGDQQGDQRLLVQALSTLLENAIRHTPAGGVVRVAATHGEETLLLTVDDSGPGVPPERREEVFERFVRVDSSRAKGAGGSGLGLAICRRLVDVMGGEVRIGQSDLGGARFIIEMPLLSGA